MVARKGRGFDADALFHAFGTKVGTPRPGGDDDMYRQVAGRDAQRFGTVENQRTDVAGFKLVGTNDFFLCLDDCRLVEGHLHLEDFCRIKQALGMFVQTENGRAFFRLVSPDPLENAHAVMQGVGEDMSGGFAPRNEFSVLPDEAVTVCHGHRISPFATDCEVMILAPGRGEGRETVSPFPLHP